MRCASIDNTARRQVGNAEDAKRALMQRMRYLDKGAQRDVYVTEDKRVVYKVDREDWLRFEGTSGNLDEFIGQSILRETPSLRRYSVPTTAYTFGDGSIVIAMPFIRHSGRLGYNDDSYRTMVERLRAYDRQHGTYFRSDVSPNNIRVRTRSRIVIIDTGIAITA